MLPDHSMPVRIPMKSSLVRLALIILAVAGTPPLARAQFNTAQPPGQISYQGYLTDVNGSPLASATPQNFNVIFNIYSNATTATPLWGESQVVTVSQGFFTVLLGGPVLLLVLRSRRRSRA